MTKHLDPLHPLDALYATVRKFRKGVKGFAEAAGVKPEYMYQKLDRENPKGHVTFGDELFDMLTMLKADGVQDWDATLVALAHQFGGLYVRLPEASAGATDECASKLVASVKEFSEFTAEIAKDAAGGIDDRELARIEKEASDALVSIQSLVLWAKGENAKSKTHIRRAA